MSFILRLFTCGLLLTSIGFSQSKDPTALELSAFEQFVSQPGTRHTRSKAVGTIESAESKALITAVVVQDAPNAREMSGVRIKLAKPDGADQVYVGEPFLGRLIAAFAEIDIHEQSRWKNRYAGASSCVGSCLFLSAMREGVHFPFASRCEMTDGFVGLSLSTGRRTFRFPNIEARPFIAVLDRAAAELQTP